MLLGLSLLLTNSCKKNSITDDPGVKLRFSVDTLTFDTVFTTLGSTTKRLKVFNDSKSKVQISSINLAGGNASNFRINIDGVAGPSQNNVEINAKDSIYIFVEVTVDPNNQNNPIIIYDSLQFVTNGNHQQLMLQAWGQDAHFFYSEAIATQTWVPDKPYVVINSVLVDSGATLNIQPGVKVYFGNGSGLIVAGTLLVNGTCQDSVEFRGLRLEEFYKDVPGQWAGIYILRSSGDCVIDHAVIKNSSYGLNLGSSNTSDLSQYLAPTHTVTVTNTIIKNSISTAIYGFYWKGIFKNCLVYNAGDNMVNFVFGGDYQVSQCTFANYGSVTINHEKAILLMGNLAQVGDGPAYRHTLSAVFKNTILDGSLDEEFDFKNDTDDPTNPFTYHFENSLVKTKTRPSTDSITNCLYNTTPQFVDRSMEDFHLANGSPCIGYGLQGLGITSDFDCKVYNMPPSIGCYEYQQ